MKILRRRLNLGKRNIWKLADKHGNNAVIETNKSLNVLRKNLSPGPKNITMLRNTKGRVTTNKEEILRILEEFYGKLHRCSGHRGKTIPYVQNEGSEDIPDIATSEIDNAL
ncbi:hypothetical protein HUJ04_011090 [Dendroctonus ponderosae]|nr:hypothetical protein HUJ04_011090 [Dendroctonus ponderosae]